MDPYRYPKLRWTLDIRMEEAQGQRVLLLRDPLGIAERPLLLVPEVAPLIAKFDGRIAVEEIAHHFASLGASLELINQLVQLLDDHLFLTTPKYSAAEQAARHAFGQLSVRAPALVGGGYPAEQHALATFVDGYLNGVNGGPGREGEIARAAHAGQMCCLVSPHIDYRRGGQCYGKTFNILRSESPDLYILIGTAHQYSEGLFHLSPKHFQTPLGELSCDLQFVEKLAQLYGRHRSFTDEILHKQEHSLELQLPFLQRIEQARLEQAARMVPILVGSFHEMLQAQREPSQYEPYETFAAALTECVSSWSAAGKRVCFIAGVDMAHVGRAFGDSGALTPEYMLQIEQRDRAYLVALESGDKRRLFAHMAEDCNARRVCGFPTMYTVLDVLGRLGWGYKAEVFDYRQAVDYKNDCAVTFAGMGFYSGNASGRLHLAGAPP